MNKGWLGSDLDQLSPTLCIWGCSCLSSWTYKAYKHVPWTKLDNRPDQEFRQGKKEFFSKKKKKKERERERRKNWSEQWVVQVTTQPSFHSYLCFLTFYHVASSIESDNCFFDYYRENLSYGACILLTTTSSIHT